MSGQITDKDNSLVLPRQDSLISQQRSPIAVTLVGLVRNKSRQFVGNVCCETCHGDSVGF